MNNHDVFKQRASSNGIARPCGWKRSIRKLSLSSLIVLGLYVSPEIKAQSVSLSLKQSTLANALDQIKKQTKYDFSVNDQLLKSAKPITAEIKNVPFEKALQQLFTDQPFTYEIIENTIILREKKSKSGRNIPLKQKRINGRVTDSTGTALPGVTVLVPGTNMGTRSDDDGHFMLSDIGEHDQVSFRLLGYESQVRTVEGERLDVVLHLQHNVLGTVDVTVNTGYQSLPKERATGSFVNINNKLLNRTVSTNLMERLNGLVPGLQFNYVSNEEIALSDPNGRNSGILVRGISSLATNINKLPLIVVDNFPYEGNINNINPNEVENITVLKDAAAASIWGSRAGNGVIVITTKRGSPNEKAVIEVNTNFTIQNKPDPHYDRNFLNSSDYIGVETELYNSGYFDTDISDNIYYRPVSPAVDLLNRLNNSGITDAEKNELTKKLESLKQRDIRNDYDRYIYQKSIKQQYALGIRGGAQKWNYSFFSGYDKNTENLKNNNFSRLTLNSQTSFRPTDKLEINTGIIYSQSRLNNPNEFRFGYGRGISDTYYGVYPYAQLMDEHGNPAEIVMDLKPEYKQKAFQDGYLDWQYRPIDEINNTVKYTNISDLILKFNLNYKILKGLNAQLYYQNERQTIYTEKYNNLLTYYTRDLINTFSVLNADKSITYQIPNTGGIIDKGNYDWNSNNGRLQFNFEHDFAKSHHINAILGVELRELKTLGGINRSYGFDKEFGSSNNALNYTDYLQTSPQGTAKIPLTSGNLQGKINRYFSQYFNLGYNIMDRYGLSLSFRRDGANLFGVATNDKITPLWSAGVRWNLHKEDFLKDSRHINNLSLRTTYGYNGNVYHGSSYVTGIYGNNSRLTGLPVIGTITAPNANLRWERIKNINLGVDFVLWNNTLSGTLEYYFKNGTDLIQNVELAPSTGFLSYFNNSASTKSNGLELNLTSQNLKKRLKWSTTYILNTYRDRITKYDVPISSSSIASSTMGVVGKPIYAVYSYKWGGLDASTGEPLGVVNGQPSKDYNAIYNNFQPDSLDFHGTISPKIFGSLRNDFAFGAFSLSFSLGYKFGHVFRRSSIGTSYNELITGFINTDYSQRWQKTGDELKTNVPAVQITPNDTRTLFYRYSAPLIEDASHLRFQDIRLSYELANKFRWCKAMQAYIYANNLGIIWRANKFGIDPDVVQSYFSHELPMPFSIAFGIKSTF